MTLVVVRLQISDRTVVIEHCDNQFGIIVHVALR